MFAILTKSYSLCKSGAAFSKVGTYKVLHHTDPSLEGIFIKKYDLTELEAAAKFFKNRTLEDNMNKLYRLSGRDRSTILPTSNFNKTTTNITFEQILEKSEMYLQEILMFSRNTFDLKFLENIQKEAFVAARDDEERTFFYPNIFEHFDDMKMFLRFHLQLNVSMTGVDLNVMMTVPFAEDGDLYEITYIPVIDSSGYVTLLLDQTVSHIIDSHHSLRFETDLESCYFKNEVFLCNPRSERILNVSDHDNYCLKSLYKGERNKNCSYVEVENDLFELTSLGHGKFYYLMENPMKYIYECASDSGFTIGYLHGSGVVTLEPNCSLTTDFESIFYNGEREELTIFIGDADQIYKDQIYEFALIVAIVTTGAIISIVVLLKILKWIRQRNQYKYMSFQQTA